MRIKKLWSSISLLLVVVLLGAACGQQGERSGATSRSGGENEAVDGAGGEHMAAAEESNGTGGSNTKAAELRAGLTGLLGEHVYLASMATGAALRGDDASFKAYSTALNGPTDSNTADIVQAVGSVYGDDVEKAFDGLWRSEGHIPGFVAYTQAVAKGDKAGQDKAVQSLLGYAKTFGTTMNKVNSNLPAAAVEEGIKMHVTTLKAVVDAQKANDQAKVYSSLREAYAHMNEFGATLAGATVKKFPEKFEDGAADSKASDLRAGLTSLLREHVLLASSATGGALGGREAEFTAAATALNGPTDSNTADIVQAVGSVYGDDVEKAFDGLWRSEGHIPGFVAYTQAVAKGDKAGQDKAVQSLLGYAKTFGTTMNKVNSNLPAAAVEDAIKMHVTTLKAVVDAQKAGDETGTTSSLREAVRHMSGTAKVLSEATVMKFPGKF